MDIDLDFANVKPSVLNWAIVGLMAITFIVFAKWAVKKFPNPVTAFVDDIVNAV